MQPLGIRNLSRFVTNYSSLAQSTGKLNGGQTVRCLHLCSQMERIKPVLSKMIMNIKVGDLLGKGGEARVYKGEITDLTGNVQDVAMRININFNPNSFFQRALGSIIPGINASNLERARLAKEAELNHLKDQIGLVNNFNDCDYILKYVVTEPVVNENGEVSGIMEKCQGSLEKLLTKEMSFCRVLKFLGDISEGIAHMHEKGYVHSDIKPENIFISEDGRTALLGDFGMTTKEGERSKGGTTYYMEGNKDVKEKDGNVGCNTKDKDIYALALTAKDLVNIPWPELVKSPDLMQLRTEINNLIDNHLKGVEKLTAREFAEKLRAFSSGIAGKEIGGEELGEGNLGSSLITIQKMRAGIGLSPLV